VSEEIDEGLSLEQMATQDAASNSTAAATETQPEPVVATETDEPESSETESEVAPPEPSRAVIDYYLSQGEQWAGRYADDTALLQAIPHLARKIGERDDDAAWAKRFTPEQRSRIEALLVQQPAAPAQPTQQDPEPPYQEGWEDLVRSANPPRDIVEKLNTHRAWLTRQILRQARNPQETVEKVVQKLLDERLKGIEEKTGQLTQSVAERERASRIQAWQAQHAGELYTEKGEFTAIGREADKLLKTDPDLMALAEVNEIAAYNNAVKIAKATVPAPKGTKPVPKAAIREPAIASGEMQNKSPEEQFLEDMEKNLTPESGPGDYSFANMLAKHYRQTAV
jgi:hypothetical protein